MTALAHRGFFDLAPSPKPLREHQALAVTMLRERLLRGEKRVVVQMPTGAGKTRFAAELIGGALGKGKRVAFTVPAISLVDQTIAAFEGEGIDAIGVMQACHVRTDRRQPVQIVSVQSLARRTPPEADMWIIDECHMRFEVVTKLMRDRPGTVFVGLSATPWARGLADDWQGLIVPVTMQELIDRGLLSPFRVFAPSHPDLSGVKTVAGDYHEGQLGEVMGGLTGDVVSTWAEKGRGLPTLVFAVNRAHAAQLVGEFANAGIAMGYCDANVDLIERRVLFDQLASGKLAGIVNVGTLTTGVDADVRCIVLARPTRSEMLFVQMIGRGLRTAPGKADCLILDHADNHARLGFVTDIHHGKLLKGSDKREVTAKDRGEPMPKACGSCGLLKPPKVRRCPKCGFEPVAQSGVEVEEGTLIEITGGKARASASDKQRFYSMLRSIARDRNRSSGWVAHAYRDKFGVWPRGLTEHMIAPEPDVIGWVRAKDIRFAKAKAAKR